MKYTKDKNITVKFLVGDNDSEKINELCTVTGLDTSKVVRLAIQKMYDEIGNISYQSARERIVNNDKYLDVYYSIINKIVAPLCNVPLATTYDEAEHKTLYEFIKNGRWYDLGGKDSGESIIETCKTAEEIAREWYEYYIDCDELLDSRNHRSEPQNKDIQELIRRAKEIKNSKETDNE